MARVEIYFPERTHWKVSQFTLIINNVKRGHYKARGRQEKELQTEDMADWMVMRGDFGRIKIEFENGLRMKFASKTLGKILHRLSKAYTITAIYDTPEKKCLVFEKEKE